MKKTTTIFQYILLGTALSLLAACGGGGGGDTPSSSKSVGSTTVSAGATTISGKIADGYLSGARVYLDRNNNRRYDNGEPTAQSTAGGAYTLEINTGEGDLYPVIAEVVAGQTVDEDGGLTVTKSYQLEAPAGRWQFVSPLTTLVKQEREKNPSLTELQAVLKVRTALGIDDNVSLFSDYLTPGTGGVQGASAQLAGEYTRTHKAARVVAALLGGLQDDISQNLGGQIAETEHNAVAYMISDQIMQQADSIKQALDNERNTAASVDVSALASSMKASIHVGNLNADMLARYEQRENQKLPTWDMQPPGLVSQSPAPGATTSIAVTVGAVFDEPLDETLISNNLLQVSGPNGLVSGVVSYDATQKRLSFTPDQVLLPYTAYQVVLNKELADTLGNSLGEDLTWNFTTTFDQTPPPLPDF